MSELLELLNRSFKMHQNNQVRLLFVASYRSDCSIYLTFFLNLSTPRRLGFQIEFPSFFSRAIYMRYSVYLYKLTNNQKIGLSQ